MKKIHILGAAVIAILAFGVVGAVSASAAQWLADEKPITEALASTIEGEITLGFTNMGKLGIKSKVLCSGMFDGTVGPGAADSITEVLSLTDVLVTLSAPLTCTPVETCTSATVAPVGLPWKTELSSVTDDELFNGGWEVVCKTTLGTFEETCVSAEQLITLENDPTEKDVLVTFVKEQTATCSLGGANSGFVESDAAGLIFLNNGEALATS
ncbi:MAG: hypothetical protein WB998_04225 [Solirubrobacteraceae bacterium]